MLNLYIVEKVCFVTDSFIWEINNEKIHLKERLA